MASKSPTRTGIRAITMQQPYAAAMCAGMCRFTRRGKATNFGADGEWIAVHVGSNNEHLNNKSAMVEIRKHWPDCPSDDELKASQKHIIGFARFRNGSVGALEKGPRDCVFMQQYKCHKPFCWETDQGYTLQKSISYPKGQLQIWHVYDEGFGDASESGDGFLKSVADDVVRQGLEKQMGSANNTTKQVKVEAEKAKHERCDEKGAPGVDVKVEDVSGDKAKRRRK
jgi:hypothetical protein